MFYEIEDTKEGGEAWQQLVECNHTWYWHRWFLGHVIVSQLRSKIEDFVDSGEMFKSFFETGKITSEETKLIYIMLTQYDILNHEGDYKQ